MDRIEYIGDLIGQHYSAEQNCWWLVREVQRDLYGRELPVVDVGEHINARVLVRAFHNHPERERWYQVTTPVDGAIVLMHRPGTHARAIHSGVYLDLDNGGVLHTDTDHGVTFDAMFDIALRNWHVEYYVPVR